MRTIQLLSVLATTVLIAACGGGDDTTTASPQPEAAIPSAVGDSVSALTEFAAQQPPSETEEPLLLGNVVPATNDTAEPTPL